MNFGQVTANLVAGDLARRTSWPARHYVYNVPGSEFRATRAPLSRLFPGVTLQYSTHIDSFKNGVCAPWFPTYDDVGASDWEIVSPFDPEYVAMMDELVKDDRTLSMPDALFGVSIEMAAKKEGESRITLKTLDGTAINAAIAKLGYGAQCIVLTRETAIQVGMENPWGDHFVQSRLADVVGDGFMGRLFGMAVWTDAFITPSKRFASVNCVM